MIRMIIDKKDACYACSHCKCNMHCRLSFSCRNSAYLRASVLCGLISHFISSRPIAKTNKCESLLYVMFTFRPQLSFRIFFKGSHGGCCSTAVKVFADGFSIFYLNPVLMKMSQIVIPFHYFHSNFFDKNDGST